MQTSAGHFVKKIRNFEAFILIALGVFFISGSCFAQTFNVIPKKDLPTTVPKYGKTSAYYTITNTTATNLIGNFLKAYPNNVTQVTCDSKYCGATFNLGANGSGTESCILKLTINGPVNASVPQQLLICTQNESSCDGTTTALNVTEGAPVPFIGIAAGTYITENFDLYPLLVKTNDSGVTWEYPRAILDNLKLNIDPNFASGRLRAAACSGSLDKSVCIAPGEFCKENCTSQFPLIAVGRRDVNFWVYPSSVFDDLKTRIDPNFTEGSLTGASCTGSGTNAFCIASGVFTTPTLQSPLIALSSNGGGSWHYPTSAFQNLQKSIDPHFSGGFLLSASCNQSTCDSVCVATGAFSTDREQQLPLVALSTDKGNNWIYPHSVFQNLKTVIDPSFQNGELVSSSCTGKGNKTICIAAGLFFNDSTTLPLLALTRNGGNTWTYPPSIFSNLSSQIDPEIERGVLRAASCTGSENTARCIGAGFFIKNEVLIPLLALTKDGGQNWTYPPYIYTKLKTIVDPNFRTGKFNGATCIDKAKNSICMAAGDFCTDRSCGKKFPLIAATKDGGKTWDYPSSVYKNLTVKINPAYLRGAFNDVSCSGTKEHSFCLASGEFETAGGLFPLTAYSIDNGDTWSYPPYVFENLSTTISPEFSRGFFSGTASTGGQ